MAWGISPRKTIVVPLGDYSPDYYLTLLYYAMQNMGWHISYFDHDGIIAYTNISWPSYSEEVSARIIDNKVHLKSECVGYQGLFTDYGKNDKNIELLFGEIEFHEIYFKDNIALTAQELMDSIPEKQFVRLDDPPMAGKELLRSFTDFFTPRKKYFVTPILVLVNIGIYVITMFALSVMMIGISRNGGLHQTDLTETYENVYLLLGFSGRAEVLHGEVWRLLSNTFLHFSLLHLLGNMIVLIYIGSLLESKIGKWTFLILYMCTGVVASMISVSWRDGGVGGGASGPIFGLFGILLALLSTDFYERSARRALLISTAIFVAYNILPISHKVDHAAHLGGLASGYVFGLIAYLGLRTEKQLFTKWTASMASVVLMLAFVATSLAFTADYQTKAFNDLIDQAKTMRVDLNGYFYNSVDMSHDERVKQMETLALPEIKKNNSLADRMETLVLSPKNKKEARYRARIIRFQGEYFRLLYLEYKYHSPKYRPAITAATDSINNIRIAWGTSELKN
jgi:rhomboid protease GluP